MPIQKEITEALSYISPNISYSDWLQIGMALHDWDSDTGYELWSSWSMNGDSYEPGICYQKWNSFRGGGGISIKTLFKFARDSGYTGEYEEEETAIIMINPEELPFIAIPERKISKEVCELYGVRTAVSEEDGRTPTLSYFPYKNGSVRVGWHVRDHQVRDGKKIKPDIGVGGGKLNFFGQDVAKRNSGKKLFVTEGRVDCLSLYETFLKCTPAKYSQYKPSIVSINNGTASAHKDFLNNREFVESFDEVILVFDPDEAGEKAVKKVLKSFPKFKTATLPPGMDCNDMRKAGRDKELHDLVLWKAQHIRQGEVVEIDEEFIKKALEKPKMGLSTPWPSIDRKIFGIRPHQIWVTGAAPKIGKSEHKNQLIQHLTFHHKRPVGVYDLEVHPVTTAKQIISKNLGVNLLRPDCKYEDKDLERELVDLSKTGIMFYDRGASREWEDIRACIEEQHIIDGVCEFFLDPLTALISRFTASEANDKLNEIMTDAADLVFKYPITLFLYSHVNNKPKGALPHERGGRVLSSEFTGSRALEKWSHFGFGISRNRSDDCPPEDENFSDIHLLYSREPVAGGKFNRLYYDNETTRYLEV